MYHGPEASESRRALAVVMERPADLFALLTDGPDGKVAARRVAEYFGLSEELAGVVLDQQLKALLPQPHGE